jgi:solute carrier family 25 carnitine/acylcarnitine transporter 20/29
MPETYKSLTQGFKQIVRHEGVSGLYKGITFPCYTQFLVGALSFTGNSVALDYLEPRLKDGVQERKSSSVIAGCCGGLLQCLALVPTELVKCRMQLDSVLVNDHMSVRQYHGAIDCFKQIIRKDGFSGLYRGFNATIVREVPSYGIYFSSYQFIANYLNSLDNFHPIVSTSLAGGIAGSLSWSVIYPVDVVKSHIQIAEISWLMLLYPGCVITIVETNPS